MIQANELRIGNWIEKFTFLGDSLGFCKVEAKDFLAMSNHPEWQNPIPLTEEVLLKCGFVQMASNNNFYYLDINDWTKIYVSFYNKDYAVELSVSKHAFCPLVQYLHQLQNLYFALTGKELEVKL